MNIQIFGKGKCFDTKKAERYFKERRVKFQSIDLKKYAKFSMACYLLMGWAIVVRIDLIYKLIGPTGFWLLLLGGIAYTVGSILYGLGKKKKWMHSVFHIFVVLGSLLQFLAVLLYAL